MPRKTKIDTTAARNVATRKRVVKQPKAAPVESLILRPTAELLAECGLPAFSIIAPTEADITNFAPAPLVIETESDANQYLGIVAVTPAVANTPAAKPAPVDTDRLLAKRAAALAVREFYAGASLPFKAAVDLRYRAPINFARFVPGIISGTHRTAGAIAAILAYCVVAPDGTFVRGSGAVPRRLLGLTERPDDTLAAGLESGVLSRLIGTGAISYIAGATDGIGAELATYRINYLKARANMREHNAKLGNGEHRFSRVLALLDDTMPASATEHADIVAGAVA